MMMMTSDKKKAAFFLTLTLVIGMLVGALVPAFFGKLNRRGMKDPKFKNERMDRGMRKDKPAINKQEWLSRAIIRVVKPDSDQVKSIRPITKQATDEIALLEKKSNERMVEILDSLKLKLKPVLNEEQNKRLEQFSEKAKGRWNGKR